MKHGRGKYDEACTKVRHFTGAAGVILVICDGDQGDGLSVQLPPELYLRVPDILRNIADQLEALETAPGKEAG